MNEMRKLMETIEEGMFGKAQPTDIEGELTMDEIQEIGRQEGFDEDGVWRAVLLSYDKSAQDFWDMEIELRSPSDQPIGRFPSITDLPLDATDPATGEEFRILTDHIWVIYKTTPEQVHELFGWYKQFLKDEQAEKDAIPFWDWIERNPFESIEEGEEDKNLGPYEDNTDKWEGQTVKITGGEHRGETGKVVKADWEFSDGGSKEGVYTVKLYSGGVVTLYLSEWSHDQIELAYDPTHRPDGRYDPELEEETNFHEEDSINDQIRSLLRQGKKVISRAAGAVGEVISIDGNLSTVQHPAETRRGTSVANFNTFKNIELVGNIDHYDIIQHWDDDGIDEGVGDWIKRLDHKAGDWIGAKAAKYIAKKVAKAVDQEGLDDIGFDISYGDKKGRDAMKDGLELYLKNEPNGEYAEQVRYILPVIAKERAKWDDIMQQAEKHLGIPANEDINEARGRVVEVPPELRGNSEMTGTATSEDASKFLADLGPDDDVSHDVVDPETGELLDWPTAGLTRDEVEDEQVWRLRGGTKRERGMADWEDREANKSDYVHVPTLYVSDRGGYEDRQDSAWELLNELRDSDFYNVVWREVGGVDVDMGDEDAFQDYDTEYEVPVLIKRKDGMKLTDDDHDNMREIVKAVKLGSTMQNTGVQYVGVTDGGTTARFVPSFM